MSSWVMMKRLVSEGVAGILVQSFALGGRPADINVVFWNLGETLPHQVKVIDDEGRLPKNTRSWQ